VLAPNYLLMTLIRVFIIWGVTALPPKKKYRPKIYEMEGEAQENDEGCIGRGDQRTSE
jgi:hypothetical protein